MPSRETAAQARGPSKGERKIRLLKGRRSKGFGFLENSNLIGQSYTGIARCVLGVCSLGGKGREVGDLSRRKP